MAEVTTTEALKKLDARLKCSLCLDYFKKPKLLPCFHVFCKSPCLDKLVTKDSRSLTCPTCRHVVPLSERGVAGLQSDFQIDHSFEMRDAFQKNKGDCGNCEDGKATGYCNDCGDFLCNECFAAHPKVKFTKNHKLITLKMFKSQVTNLVPPKKAAPNCPKHSENPLKIYCATCSTLICTDCTVLLHKDHEYNLVSDVLTQHKEELVSSLKPVKEKLVTVQQALKEIDTREKSIQDQRATIEVDIQREIDTLLNERKAKLVGELEKLTQQKLKALATHRDHVKMTEAKLSSCVEYAEGGLKIGTDGEVLEMKASILKRVEDISTEFDSSTIQPETMADLKLQIKGKERVQQACRGFLDIDCGEKFSLENSKMIGEPKDAVTGEIKSVYFKPLTKNNKSFEGQINFKAKLVNKKSKKKQKCEVVVKKNGQHEISYHPVYRGMNELHISVNEVPVRGSPFPITVTGLPEKPIKVIQLHARNMTDSLNDVVVNSKGQLVVVGTNGFVLTAEGKKVSLFFRLKSAYGVTVDQNDCIYVAEKGNGIFQSPQISKYSAAGNLITATRISRSNDLQVSSLAGICYNQGTKNLYVVDQDKIRVLTTDLKQVKKFGTHGKDNGQFQNPKYVAFDSTNNLYVTDTDNHRVQVFTADGKFLRAFSQKNHDQELKSPYGIAIDSSDTVYVSENGRQCISVFTSQGEYITMIGDEGYSEGQFKDIRGLCVDCNDSVIVSDYGNNRLQVF